MVPVPTHTCSKLTGSNFSFFLVDSFLFLPSGRTSVPEEEGPGGDGAQGPGRDGPYQHSHPADAHCCHQYHAGACQARILFVYWLGGGVESA